jgi:hypothetical protein
MNSDSPASSAANIRLSRADSAVISANETEDGNCASMFAENAFKSFMIISSVQKNTRRRDSSGRIVNVNHYCRLYRNRAADGQHISHASEQQLLAAVFNHQADMRPAFYISPLHSNRFGCCTVRIATICCCAPCPPARRSRCVETGAENAAPSKTTFVSKSFIFHP